MKDGIRPLVAGDKIGRYEIEALKDQNEFSALYQARDARLERPVLLWEYLPAAWAERREDGALRPRPEMREAYGRGLAAGLKESLALLNLPAVAPLLDYFEENATLYRVWPVPEGVSLAERLAAAPEGRLSEAELSLWLGEFLEMLEAAHARGLRHLNLRPENIILGAGDAPSLTGFGALKPPAEAPDGYAAVEQYGTEQANLGPWTDIYALGAVILRALTGLEPPAATARRDAALNGEADPLETPLARLSELASPNLAQATAASLSLARKNRPQSAAELRARLGGAAAQAPPAQVPFGAAPPRSVSSTAATGLGEPALNAATAASSLSAVKEKARQWQSRLASNEAADLSGLDPAALAELRAAYIQKQAAKYVPIMAKMDAGSGGGFDWAAALFFPLWMAYRKLYIYRPAQIYGAIWVITGIIVMLLNNIVISVADLILFDIFSGFMTRKWFWRAGNLKIREALASAAGDTAAAKKILFLRGGVNETARTLTCLALLAIVAPFFYMDMKKAPDCAAPEVQATLKNIVQDILHKAGAGDVIQEFRLIEAHQNSGDNKARICSATSAFKVNFLGNSVERTRELSYKVVEDPDEFGQSLVILND